VALGDLSGCLGAGVVVESSCRWAGNRGEVIIVAASTADRSGSWGDRALGALQSIGRSLMLPIAVLPAAALLLRLGQPDLLNIPWLAAAGQAVFDNLPALFAIGVAVGLTGGAGAAGLAGLVGYFVFAEVFNTLARN
jgi:N-acetylglucosamine PTS system EIICBA or EIICB component